VDATASVGSNPAMDASTVTEQIKKKGSGQFFLVQFAHSFIFENPYYFTYPKY